MLGVASAAGAGGGGAALESPGRPHTCAPRGRPVGVAAAAADHLGSPPRGASASRARRAGEAERAAGWAAGPGPAGEAGAGAAAPLGLAPSRQQERGGQEGGGLGAAAG